MFCRMFCMIPRGVSLCFMYIAPALYFIISFINEISHLVINANQGLCNPSLVVMRPFFPQNCHLDLTMVSKTSRNLREKLPSSKLLSTDPVLMSPGLR